MIKNLIYSHAEFKLIINVQHVMYVTSATQNLAAVYCCHYHKKKIICSVSPCEKLVLKRIDLDVMKNDFTIIKMYLLL